MFKAKICLDSGHGAHDSGAIFSGLKEKDIVLSVSNLMVPILLSVPYIDVFTTRDKDVFHTPGQRARMANEWGVDYLLSLHCNADPDDDTNPNLEAEGQEIWIAQGSKTGRAYAEIMKDYVDLCFPEERFRGIHESSKLTVLTATKMPANLVEIGFIDKRSTNRKFSDGQTIKDIALALSLGIIEVVHSIWKSKVKKTSYMISSNTTN